MNPELPFLDRRRELKRLEAHFKRPGGLAVVYGRRRIGKTRLVRVAALGGRSVVFTGDDREAPLQRRALALAVETAVPGFAAVEYQGWEALLNRFGADAPRNSVLALDEFPSIAFRSPELPSLLQKAVDGPWKRLHLVLCGSSQRMMQGLVLDSSAPLYGRATEIIRLGPLPAGWIREALGWSGAKAVDAYAALGGVPRYWELARGAKSPEDAATSLILDPLGPLHEEPGRLLLDDTRDIVQSASILSLVGGGARRLTEIAGRLGKPATSLTRPIQRLLELGLLERETPFGAAPRKSRIGQYRIADPFLRLWFRIVEPNRSLLRGAAPEAAAAAALRGFPALVAEAWEDLSRAAIPALPLGETRWGPASRWWGPGIDHAPMELDLVAESLDRRKLLLGEVSWERAADSRRDAAELQRKAALFPLVAGRPVVKALFRRVPSSKESGVHVLGPDEVLDALK